MTLKKKKLYICGFIFVKYYYIPTYLRIFIIFRTDILKLQILTTFSLFAIQSNIDINTFLILFYVTDAIIAYYNKTNCLV